MNRAGKKIAIVSSSLGSGGAERFSGLLSCMLSNAGYEIHNVIINDRIDYEYCGALFNIGKICAGDSFLWRKIRKGKLLGEYLAQNHIDTIIDNRSRNVQIREILARRIYGKRDIYYVVHSYNLQNYFPRCVWLSKILYRNAQKLVCVSHAIESEIKRKYHFKNTISIYNPVKIDAVLVDVPQLLPNKFVLFFGRIEEKVKNFNLMLEAFKISEIQKSGYLLLIMGVGPDKKAVMEKINGRGLSDYVKMVPFNKNPSFYVEKARFTLLTSHFEGFPMSLIESLALGTPVVSVNCQSGPQEIIRDGENGLLVENYNPKSLAKAMVKLAEDDVLYDICKDNAAKSVAHLSIGSISRQWVQMLSKT